MTPFDPIFDAPVMTPAEFVDQLAEDGFGLETNPDVMSREELVGCWACLQSLVDDARLVMSHADPDDDCAAVQMVREIALRDRVSRDMLGEGPDDYQVLVEALRASRDYERRACELAYSQSNAPRM